MIDAHVKHVVVPKYKHTIYYNVLVGGHSVPPKRCSKEIYSISKRALTKIRDRLTLWWFASQKQNLKLKFITLTTKKNEQNVKQFRELTKRFVKETGGLFFYVLERQKRGAVHAHIVTDTSLGVRDCQKIWSGISQENYNNSLDYKLISSVEDVSQYMGKYLSKQSIEGRPYAFSHILTRINYFCYPVDGFFGAGVVKCSNDISESVDRAYVKLYKKG